MKVGDVVLSRKDINGLDARLENASRNRLAEKNHAKHELWVADWERRQALKGYDAHVRVRDTGR
jgi:hypothetical protein